MKTRESIIARAKEQHDLECACSPKYLMSCGNMARIILAQGADDGTQVRQPGTD